MADDRPLRAAPQPADEPVVLTINGENLVVWPTEEPAYVIAHHARQFEHDLQNAERSLRGVRAALAKARNDVAEEAEKKRLVHPEREQIKEAFELWRRESGRKGCKLTAERFDLVAARLREDYEPKFILMAAVGIAVNPYVIEGEVKNDFETAFKDGSAVERYVKRCPRERREEIALEGRVANGGRLFS